MAESRRWTVRCPECEAHLVIDAATGEVLSHKKEKTAPAGGRGLDELMEEMQEGKSQAEDVFQREVAAMKDRDRLLEEKFREALKRAEEDPDDGPPPSPFDFD